MRATNEYIWRTGLVSLFASQTVRPVALRHKRIHYNFGGYFVERDRDCKTVAFPKNERANRRRPSLVSSVHHSASNFSFGEGCGVPPMMARKSKLVPSDARVWTANDPTSPSSPCVAGHMTGKNLSTTERLFLHLLFLSLFLLLLLFHYFSLLILPLSLWSLKSGTRTAWRGSPVPVAPTNSVPTEVSSRLGVSQHRPRRKIFRKYDSRGKRGENEERISLREDQTWNKDFQTLDCILRLKASSRRLSGPRLDRINKSQARTRSANAPAADLEGSGLLEPLDVFLYVFLTISQS